MLWKYTDIQNLSKYRNQIYGMCSVWIMLFHGVTMDKVHLNEVLPRLNDLLKYCNVGVDMFLFLSGMGCFFSYKKKLSYDSFIKARLQRVAIPYSIWGG